jgi:thiol:disulfide interchange protein
MLLGRLIGKAWSAFRARYWAWLGVAGLALAFGFALRQSSSEADFYSRWGADPDNLPYRSDVDARTAVELGKAQAAASGKMLMVTFGANWCPDCLTLAKNLRDPDTRAYAENKFEMVHIDVGDSNKTHASAISATPGGIRSPCSIPPTAAHCDMQGGSRPRTTSRRLRVPTRAQYCRVVTPING